MIRRWSSDNSWKDSSNTVIDTEENDLKLRAIIYTELLFQLELNSLTNQPDQHYCFCYSEWYITNVLWANSLLAQTQNLWLCLSKHILLHPIMCNWTVRNVFLYVPMLFMVFLFQTGQYDLLESVKSTKISTSLTGLSIISGFSMPSDKRCTDEIHGR